MKRMFVVAMFGVMAMAGACSPQNPQLAALEAEMQGQLATMALAGATPQQVEEYRAQMLQRAQTLMQQQPMQMAGGGFGGSPGGYPEPTEAEMRSVFEAQFGGVEQRVDDMKSQCDNVRSTNDPMVGIACLMGMAADQPSAQVGMSSFRKVGCEKSSRPGWNCDYIIGVHAAALSAFGGGGQEAQTRRFVKSDGRWIAMDY